GLSNALANLHNACRARVPLINVIGDHASFHSQYETPLASDIAALARPCSAWLRKTANAAAAGQDCADAIAAAHRAPGGIATLILPADAAWGNDGVIGRLSPVSAPPLPVQSKLEHAADRLRSGGRVALVLGLRLATGHMLTVAGQIATKTGAQLLAPFAFSRIERGAGRSAIERIAYVTEQ